MVVMSRTPILTPSQPACPLADTSIVRQLTLDLIPDSAEISAGLSEKTTNPARFCHIKGGAVR
jgi:hypothetical protein